MPTLDWLSRDAAFRIAQQVLTRVLRAHGAGPGEVLYKAANGLGLTKQIDAALG